MERPLYFPSSMSMGASQPARRRTPSRKLATWTPNVDTVSHMRLSPRLRDVSLFDRHSGEDEGTVGRDFESRAYPCSHMAGSCQSFPSVTVDFCSIRIILMRNPRCPPETIPYMHTTDRFRSLSFHLYYNILYLCALVFKLIQPLCLPSEP